MNDLKDFKNHILKKWQEFLPAHKGWVAIREIKTGLTDDLLIELKASHFYSEKKPSKMSETREKEWAEARRLELEMENQFGKNLGEFSMLSSISHTSQTSSPLVIAVSALVPKQNPLVQGVGVDVEAQNRNITSEVAARFLRKEENRVPINDVDLWVLKEAAFKATPKDLQLVVSEYKLTQWDEAKEQGQMVSKNAKCSVCLVRHSGFAVGLAYFRF